MVTILRPVREKIEHFAMDVRYAKGDQGSWFVGVSQVLTRTVIAVLFRPLVPYLAYYFDRRLGVDTRGIVPLCNETISSAAHADSNHYEPTPARPFSRLIKSLRLHSPSGYTFIDLGCGKGLAMVLAAKHGFGRVVGIELDPHLLESARDNVGAFQGRLGTSGPVELIREDAARYQFPSEPTVVFLFNPFGEQTMRAVAKNIQQSLEEVRRPLLVAYINPAHEKVFDEIPILRRIPNHGEKWACWWAI